MKRKAVEVVKVATTITLGESFNPWGVGGDSGTVGDVRRWLAAVDAAGLKDDVKLEGETWLGVTAPAPQ